MVESIAGLPVVTVAEREDWIKALIYGVPGAGKTMLAGSAAEIEAMSPVLFVDIEGGTKSIRAKYPNVEVLRVRDEFQVKNGQPTLVKTAWQRLQDVYEEARKGGLPYKTFVLDSLTEAHKVSMASIMRQVAQKDPERDPDIPAMRDWGKGSEQIRRMVRAFRDLDAHVIFTALETSTKDQLDGSITIHPSLPGKLAMEIPGYLDLVLYLYAKPEKGEIVRRMLCQPSGKYIAKDRSGRLPTTMEAPTMSKIAELALD